MQAREKDTSEKTVHVRKKDRSEKTVQAREKDRSDKCRLGRKIYLVYSIP